MLDQRWSNLKHFCNTCETLSQLYHFGPFGCKFVDFLTDCGWHAAGHWVRRYVKNWAHLCGSLISGHQTLTKQTTTTTTKRTNLVNVFKCNSVAQPPRPNTHGVPLQLNSGWLLKASIHFRKLHICAFLL